MQPSDRNHSDLAIAAGVLTQQPATAVDGAVDTSLTIDPWIVEVPGASFGTTVAVTNTIITTVSRLAGIAALVAAVGLVVYLFK